MEVKTDRENVWLWGLAKEKCETSDRQSIKAVNA